MTTAHGNGILTQNDTRSAQGYSGYWTFLPLYKETCDTYTESVGISEGGQQCRTFPWETVNLPNLCVTEPVPHPKGDLSARGIVQLVRVRNGDGRQQQPADYGNWSHEYQQEGVAWPYDCDRSPVRWGLNSSQMHPDNLTGNVKSLFAAKPFMIDNNSPLVGDCVRAVSKFYAPLWNNVLDPTVSDWTNGCRDQVPTIRHDSGAMKACAVVASAGTCEVQLIFDYSNSSISPSTYYSDHCLGRWGGGLWNLLGAFGRILSNATAAGGDHVAGIVGVPGDSRCNYSVAFVPSNGAKVTFESGYNASRLDTS